MEIPLYVIDSLEDQEYLLFIFGTKKVKPALKSICQGAKKNEGKTWFHELSDKRRFHSDLID